MSFYRDGLVISDGDLVDTNLREIDVSTTQKFIQLEFLNSQPVHDGVYHCLASAGDTNEELFSDLYLYGSSEDCVCVCVHEVDGPCIDSAACCAIHML